MCIRDRGETGFTVPIAGTFDPFAGTLLFFVFGHSFFLPISKQILLSAAGQERNPHGYTPA